MPFDHGHALLIGVGRYFHMPRAGIPIAVKDAQQVSDVLRDERFCAYPKEHVTLLHDELAGREGVLQAFGQLAEKTTPQDTALIYYSGHGSYGTDGLFYMTTSDTRASEGKISPGTAISEKDLLAALEAIPAGKLIFFFNACHSGEVSPHFALEDHPESFDPANLPNATADAILGSGSGRVIITACREGQLSWIGKGKISIFAQALVDGLKGGARNNGGYIGAFGLYEYLFEAIKEAAGSLEPAREQEPELTVLKNVGLFPVALRRGASQPQAFDPQADRDLPEEAAVRWVSERASQRAFLRVNIHTGGGAFIGGHVDSGGGNIAGRDQVNVNIQGDVKAPLVNGPGSITLMGQPGDPAATGMSDSILNTGTLNLFFASYQAPSGRAHLDKQNFERILQEYLQWVVRAYDKARLYGLESMRVTRQTPNRRLAEVFVPLTLRRIMPPSLQEVDALAQEQEANPLAGRRAYLRAVETRREQGEDVALHKLLTKTNRLAIIGGAGSGKSTLAAYLAASLARAALLGQEPPFRLPKGRKQLLPVVIPLRYYREYLRLCEVAPQERLHNARAGSLAGLIPWYLRRRNPALELSEDFIDRLLLGGGCLLILDGLDEIANRAERGRVRAQVEALANDIYPGNLILVTARESGYREDAVFGDDFTRLDVQPLSEEQLGILVKNWCRQLYSEAIEVKSKQILSAIREINRRYMEQDLPPLVSTPLMTTMVVSVQWGENELPRERARLYEAAVKVILQAQYLEQDETRQELVDWGGPWEEQREWLAHLALEMQHDGRDGAAISEERVREILSGYPGMNPEKLDAFILAVRLRGGLFEERAELFQFAHLTFQEFLAARLLVKMRQEGLRVLLPLATEPWWREVGLLLYGFAREDHPPFAAQYLDWLGMLPEGERRLAGLELAAAAILEIERPDPALRRQQAARLLGALLDRQSETRPATRVQADYTLSSLGDPRFNPSLFFLPDEALLGFVEIPAGPFWMGSDPKKDPNAYDDEQPFHKVELSTYYMARYPVTAAQFWDFVEQSRFEPKYRFSLHEIGNYPVIAVTWQHAQAYCAWLERSLREQPGLAKELQGLFQTGYRVQLPTEAQWEKAARGADGRIYPWGDEIDPNKANTAETGVQTTTPVGIFLEGASPYGIQDMIGNVWEWCADWYEESYYGISPAQDPQGPAKGDHKVLRGGSWRNSQYYARCVYRVISAPDFGDNLIGFRCVLSR